MAISTRASARAARARSQLTFSSPYTPPTGDGAFWTSQGDTANALVVDRSGRLVAAGSSFFNDGKSQRFALARYHADGTLDQGFGRYGRVLTNVNSAADVATAAIIQQTVPSFSKKGSGDQREPWRPPPSDWDPPDFPLFSKLVAGGISGDPGTPPTASLGARFTLIRYENDGRLDASFGKNGIVRAPHFPLVDRAGKRISRFDRLAALAVQRDGRLVAVGSAEFDGGIRTMALARFNANGRLDSTFGGSGMVLIGIPASVGQATASAVGIQSNGKIVVAGGTVGGSGSDLRFVLARRNSDGSPDTDFGSRGLVVTNVTTRTSARSGAEGANALVIKANGKIVVGRLRRGD